MANFSGLILTDRGRDILAAALTGETLTFTRVALGDGVAPANPEGLATLVSEKRNAPIQSFAVIGDGTSRIRAIVTNVGLATGFFAREVGVFATDPDTGSETLYAYANAGDQADYLPAEGGATIVEQLFDLITVVDTAPNVTAVINDSLIYATKDELTGVALEGDTLVFPGSTNTYLITNFSSFAAYSVSSDIGTATVTGDTVSLVIDAGQASGGLNMIVTRDGYEYVFRIAIGAQSVAQPVIENPAEGVTDVGSGVTLTTSAFLTYPEGADTHASTDWQVATDAGFTAIVFESLADVSNLESIAVPSGTFSTSTTYYARARHSGTTLGASAYSPTVSFTTAVSFYPSAEVAKLLAGDGASGDLFGISCSISGNYAVVGAYGKNSFTGAAYIFERDGVGNWSQVQKLTANDAAGTDQFGLSVSISGNYAIVGAVGNDDAGTNSGSAYIFERDGSGNWAQAAKLTASDGAAEDNFGWYVGIDGSYAIVGARGDDTNGNSAGAAYIFERDGAGNWTQAVKLTASDAAAADLFGDAVAISGNYAIVGAVGNDDAGTDSGSAYIFERDGSGNWTEVAKLLASDAATGDSFGDAVAISGSYAIVGAFGNDDAGASSGSAYIFERNGVGNWVQVAKLLASDGTASDSFGYTVAISGNCAIVGATYDADNGSNAGSAYIFERDGAGNWAQASKLIASDAAANQLFAWSVGISGSYALMGARGDATNGSNAGAAYIFE